MKPLMLLLLFLLTACGKSELNDITPSESVGGGGGGGGAPATTGTVTGIITNAQNGASIAGATVTVGALSDTTDGSGLYTIGNVATGAATVSVAAGGYVSQSDATTVADGQTSTVNMALLTATYSANKFLVVLTWGANPTDLDSHLLVPNTAVSTFHLYYQAKGDFDGTLDSVPYAGLDNDETLGHGPETVAISWDGVSLYYPRNYRYYIYNYSNNAALNASGAQVRVYSNGVPIQTFNVPDSCTDRYWHVFDVAQDSTITPVGNCGVAPPPNLY